MEAAAATLVCSKFGNFNPKVEMIKSTVGVGGVFRPLVHHHHHQRAVAVALDRVGPFPAACAGGLFRPLVRHDHGHRRGVAVVVDSMRSPDRRLVYDSNNCIVESLCSDELDFDFDANLFFQLAVPLEKYHILGLGQHLLVIGLPYQNTYPTVLRRLDFCCPRMPVVVYELSSLPHVDEAAFISGCSQFEIYAVVHDPSNALEELCEWMAKETGIPLKKLRLCCYWHFGRNAWRHLFEVASGLRNLLPDGRKLRKVKEIADALDGFRGFGRILKTLFEHAISVGERVASEVKLLKAGLSTSLASATVELALAEYKDFDRQSKEYLWWEPRPQTKAEPQILVIGSGRMGVLLIKSLFHKGYKTITLLEDILDNFDTSRPYQFSSLDPSLYGGALVTHKPRQDMASCIAEADIVFTCRELNCNDDKPFVMKEHIFCDGSSKDPPTHLKLFVDTSIPHNVDEDSVSQLPFCRILNLDDIEKEILRKEKMEVGRMIMKRVRGYIDEEVGKFESWFNKVGAVHILQSLRGFMKLKYAREMEERRPHVVVGSSDHDIWKQQVNMVSIVRADHYMDNLIAQLVNVLDLSLDDCGVPLQQLKYNYGRNEE
ncbi:hypothetical protein LguiA_001607 [Lonicera macranthoides]